MRRGSGFNFYMGAAGIVSGKVQAPGGVAIGILGRFFKAVPSIKFPHHSVFGGGVIIALQRSIPCSGSFGGSRGGGSFGGSRGGGSFGGRR